MRIRTAVALTATALLLGGTYLTLDVLDIVPGTLTLNPPYASPAPYPEITAEVPVPTLPSSELSAVAGDVTAVVDAFMEDERMGGVRAATVIDASTGSVLANRNGSTAMPPASSTKVLTAAATLSTIDPQRRLATTATLSGTRLTLVGGGDILLTTGDPLRGDIHEASLTDLAEQTAAALQTVGITEVSLAVDASLFQQRGYNPFWDEIDALYVMPIAPIAVAGGWIERNTYEEDPALAAARDFALELRALGVGVAGEPRHAPSPDDAIQVGVVRSAPVEEIVRYMLKVSENSVTEVMGLLTAIELGLPSTFAGSTEAVKTALHTLGLPTESLALGDVCGLTYENQITSDLLASTVQASFTEPSLLSLVSSFPVTFLDGTLANRGAEAAGYVRAKTGTLSDVVSLTGVVHADSGAVIVFSAIASETENNWEARVGIDEFAANLKKTG